MRVANLKNENLDEPLSDKLIDIVQMPLVNYQASVYAPIMIYYIISLSVMKTRRALPYFAALKGQETATASGVL